MPIYEFRCRACAAITSVFQRSRSAPAAPACDRCGRRESERAISRFATPKTEQQVLEQYGTPSPGAGSEAWKDPRQIGRWTEKQFADLGMEMPTQTRAMIEAAREGDLPDSVKDL